MADHVPFIDNQPVTGNFIDADWLNPVNNSVYQGKNPSFVESTGTDVAYIITLPSSTLTTVSPGQQFTFRAHVTNGENPTLQVIGASSTPALPIILNAAVPLIGTIIGGAIITVVQNVDRYEIVGGAIIPLQVVPVTGQCQLQYTSNTTLTLIPFNGNAVLINSSTYFIPTAGFTLSNSGAASDTDYFIYLDQSAGGTLIRSLVAPLPQEGTGIMIEGLNSAASFVGIARTNASGEWADSATQRFVRSWFNESGICGAGELDTPTNVSSVPFVEVSSAARASFLAWEHELITATMIGSGADAAASGFVIYGAVGLDGASGAAVGQGTSAFTTTANGDLATLGGTGSYALTEGLHYVTPLAGISGGGDPEIQVAGVTYTTTRR